MITTFIIGFFFISIIGTLLHFVFDYSKHNKVIALFGAVNESTWEHIKLALTPYFLWSILDGLLFGNYPNYFFAKLIGCLSIIIVMPSIFYGYKVLTKKNILFIDILSFFVTVFCSQYFTYLILNASSFKYYINYISLIMIFIIFGFYMVATLFPLKNFLFKDPITKQYGIKGHYDNSKKDVKKIKNNI